MATAAPAAARDAKHAGVLRLGLRTRQPFFNRVAIAAVLQGVGPRTRVVAVLGALAGLIGERRGCSASENPRALPPPYLLS